MERTRDGGSNWKGVNGPPLLVTLGLSLTPFASSLVSLVRRRPPAVDDTRGTRMITAKK